MFFIFRIFRIFSCSCFVLSLYFAMISSPKYFPRTSSNIVNDISESLCSNCISPLKLHLAVSRSHPLPHCLHSMVSSPGITVSLFQQHFTVVHMISYIYICCIYDILQLLTSGLSSCRGAAFVGVTDDGFMSISFHLI